MIATALVALGALGVAVGAVDAWRVDCRVRRARAALKRALRSGPGSVPELIYRARQESGGKLRLGDEAYGVLCDLEREGWVESWVVEPPSGLRSRPRKHYQLRRREAGRA